MVPQRTVRIAVHPSLKGLGVYVVYSLVDEVKVLEGDHFRSELALLEEEIRREGDTKLNPIAQAYRRFYWKVGLDPTKTRPAGEALRRRVLNGGHIPLINTVVDAGNIVSAKTLVPIGLYDARTLSGSLVLKPSKGGEKFLAIGSAKEETLPPGLPILVDEADPEHVIHLYPHRDSQKTMITKQTTRVLVVGAGVEGVAQDYVRHAVEMVVEKIVESSGGKLVEGPTT